MSFKDLIPPGVVVPYEVAAKRVIDGLMSGVFSWHIKLEKKHGER
jgi:hypothetical protein